MYKLAVIGNPVKNSLSPEVFNLFAKQANIKIEYSKILAVSDTFSDVLEKFFTNGGLAVNITSPFKNLAYLNVKNRTIRATFCHASNFIKINDEGELVADTTDGIGLINALKLYQKYNLENKNILIIGSGFVVDSILLDIIEQKPHRLDVLGRNNQRVEYLKNKFAINKFNILLEYDLIINTTPNIEENNLFNLITAQNIKNQALCYDLSYQKSLTLFHEKILKIKSDVVCVNGIGMLIEQASVAFKNLFKISIDTMCVFEKLNNKE
ncbi:MAG TPA: hypothetical protein PKD00_10315 [Burkholderiales bacterium]|nr:hypothetical protein [Burkholderiales bacterium]